MMPEQAFTVPPWLGDNMVLQAGMPVRIRGWATSTSEIHIHLNRLVGDSESGQFHTGETEKENFLPFWSNTVLADQETGEFSFVLPAMEASHRPYELTIDHEDYEYVFSNLLFGEVWIAAGESNMSMPVMYTDVDPDIHLLSKLKNIRFFTCRESGLNQGETAYSPRAQRTIPGAAWINFSNIKAMQQVSAVALSFAAHLAKTFNIPIGIYDIACSETCLHSWLPLPLEEEPAIKQHLKACGLYRTQETYNQPRTEAEEAQMRRELKRLLQDKAFRMPKFMYRRQPAAILNHKVYPLRGVAAQGVLWYQGESDVYFPQYYLEAFPFLAETFRYCFESPQGQLKIILTQLAPFYYSTFQSDILPDFNNMLVYLKDLLNKNQGYAVGLVATYDLPLTYHKENAPWGTPQHPWSKREIGRRMGELALGLAYKSKLPVQTVTCSSSPEISSATCQANQMILNFQNSDKSLQGQTLKASMKGFSMAGYQDFFTMAKARNLYGMQVLLESESVMKPVSCSFAYYPYNTEMACLNSKNLPLLPFRHHATQYPDSFQTPPYLWQRAFQAGYDASHYRLDCPNLPWLACDLLEIWALPRVQEMDRISQLLKTRGETGRAEALRLEEGIREKKRVLTREISQIGEGEGPEYETLKGEILRKQGEVAKDMERMAELQKRVLALEDEIAGLFWGEHLEPKLRPVWEFLQGKVDFAMARDNQSQEPFLEVAYRRMGNAPIIFGPILDYLSLYPPLDLGRWRELTLTYKKNGRRNRVTLALRLVALDGTIWQSDAQTLDVSFNWGEVTFSLPWREEKFTKVKGLYFVLTNELESDTLYLNQITFEGLVTGYAI